MAEKKIFVGRKAELEQFTKALEDKKGQAILVAGQAGMGKTWLANKFCEMAEKHPDLRCGCVRYEVTPTDSVDSTMALMMDNAFEAANIQAGSFDNVPERKRQWWALLKLAKLVPAGKIIGKAFGDKVEIIAELWKSLQRNPQRNTREQFLERLKLISKRMPENGRAIFIIDPEKYMQDKSDQSWAIIVRDLPEKIKFVFAQRLEDALVGSDTFGRLDNVVNIPKENLDVLEEEAVDDLLNQRIGELQYSVTEVRKVLNRSKGYPYALGAALDLLEAGTKIEELPKKPEPTKFAEKQWQKVCDNKDGAIELFEAYAVLEVGVPDDVVEHVSGLKPAERKRIMADKFIRGLLREETDSKRIYHAILADYILSQIIDKEKKEYHKLAVEVYREKLQRAAKEQTKPDELAAVRLADHVLSAEGPMAFVVALANECTQPLLNLGVLDAVINLSERAMAMMNKRSEEQAVVLGNLGLIYRRKGELDKAEELHIKALVIQEKIGLSENIALTYGNLGLIYQTRGDLNEAEEMHNKSLEIEKKLGRLEGMANQYGNLGLIYHTRGDLNKAEEMHNKALEIDKKLGQLEGMASDYGNLGNVYYSKGELDKAEELHNKALEINEKLGRLEGMARQYGNLGLIYQTRGELDKAEEMHKRSLEISEKLGLLEVMANQYGKLGILYKARGDFDKARNSWERARYCYDRIGALYMIDVTTAEMRSLSEEKK